MPENYARRNRSRVVATALLFVVIGIWIGVASDLGREIANDAINLPLVSKEPSPNGELTAYVFDTDPSFVTVWTHHLVYIAKSNVKPRKFVLVFDSELSGPPMVRWKNDDSLVISCLKSTRIMSFVNWWYPHDADLPNHAVGIGMTCAREPWRDVTYYGPFQSPQPVERKR